MHPGTTNSILIATLTVVIITCMFLISDRYDIYRINDISMQPYLEDGDKILARRRTKEITSNLTDRIVIFYFPYKGYGPSMSPDSSHLLIKRCIASPGDSVCIDKGVVINSKTGISSFHDTQISPPGNPSPLFYSVISNNCKNGNYDMLNMPWIYIPRKGDTISIDKKEKAWHLYRKIIDYEVRHGNRNSSDSIHIFDRNYYFVCGDNITYSYDSRNWGFLPEDFIISYKIKD